MESLLASYGSDDEDEQEETTPRVGVAPSLPAPSDAPPKVSLFGRLPAPKNSGSGTPAQPSGSLFASLPPPQFGAKSSNTSFPFTAADVTSQEPSRPSLFAKLPPPKSEKPETSDGNPNHGDPPLKSSLFAALPPPKVESDRSVVKVETLDVKPRVKKQPVSFKPPIDVSVLEDNDDGWRPAQKKAKAEPSPVIRSGGGLSSLLPAPKNSLGSGATLGSGAASGGRRAAMEIDANPVSHDLKPKEEPFVVNSRIPTTFVSNDSRAFQAQVQYDHSSHVLDQSAASAPQLSSENNSYGYPASTEAYAQEISHSTYNVDRHYEQQNWQYSGNVPYYASHSTQANHEVASSPSVVDPVAQVLQSERRRGREDKLAASNVIEVKQADLTGGKIREDQLRVTGIAFGPSYQPVSSSKDKPSKIHRRKHQIGTLLHDMKSKEMELLERRAKGNLTKAETHAKYGW